MDSNTEFTKKKTKKFTESSQNLLNSSSIGSEKIMFVILSLVYVRPHFSFLPDLISVYWPDFVIALAAISYLLRNDNNKKRYTNISLSFKISELVLLVGLLIPILIKFIVYGFSFDTLFAYSKLIYYYIVFITFSRITSNVLFMKKKINKIIEISFIWNFFVSLIQLLAIPVFFDFVSIIYGSEKLRTIWTGYARVYGTFYNANWFGVYILFIISWMNERMINKDIRPSRYFISWVIIIFMLVISGSRTAVMGAILITCIQLMRGLSLRKVITVFVVFIPVLLGIISIISQIEILGRTLGRFTYMIDLILLNGFNMETLAGSRWPEWQNSLKVFYESPWIGSSINNFIPHNSYISVLIRFGLIGTIIMLFFIVMLAQRMKSTNLDNNTVFFLTASSGFTWGFLFVCIGGDYLFSTQVMLLLVTSLSIMQSSLRDSNSKTKK